MSRRIGEILIERGLIDREQLRAALQSQLVLGGTLGTCLIDQGILDESSLGRVLAEATGLPRAPEQMFADIPPAVIEAVPPSEVAKRRFVPIGLEGKDLHVAVITPNSVDNLSTLTGYKIVRYVAPESRILRAMEKYYAIPFRRRFIPVPGPGENADAEPGRAATPHPSATDVIRRRRAVQRRRAAESDTPPELAELSARLSEVASHGELGEVLLDYGVRKLERCILFAVSEEGASVVNWKGVDLDADRVHSLSIPLTPQSIFGLMLENSYHRGEVPDEHALFYRQLRLERPKEALILPIYGDDQLDAVLYADPGTEGRIAEPEDHCMVLMEKINLTMKMLSLRMQLCPP